MAVQPATLKNDNWFRSAFVVPGSLVKDLDKRHRFTSDARMKFGDTTLGGSLAINAPPQYCRYADIKVSGILAGRAASVDNPIYRDLVTSGKSDSETDSRSAVGSRGYGDYYNDAIDNTGEYITLRFGVPKFNSLLGFFTNFYDPEASATARTGKGNGLLYQGGRMVGAVVGMALAPGLMTIRTIGFFLGTRVSKFYYLESAMHNYWVAANNIANTIAVYQNIIPRVGGRSGETREDIAARWEQIKAYNRALPDVFREDGGIDLFHVATRYNRLALRFQEKINEIALGADSLNGFGSDLVKFLNRAATTQAGALYDFKPKNIAERIEEYLSNQENLITPETAEKATLTFPYNDEVKSSTYSWYEEIRSGMEAGINDAYEFVTFRVDSTGPTTETFSNTVGESSIAGKLNGMVSGVRSMRFDAAEFQTGVGMVDAVTNGIKSMITGAADAIGVSGLAAFAGNSNIDIPQTWQSSAAQLPKMTYTMELRSWSGTPMGRFRRLWVPVSMLLAGALPLSHGKQAYGSPFICEAYSRNRISCKLGMIDSLTITRGVGNLGRNMEGDPLGVTVQFSIVDMSSIVHMPITTGIGLWGGLTQAVGSGGDNVYNGVKEILTGEESDSRFFQATAAALDPSVYDDSNAFTDYMAVLGGLGLTEQIYAGQKWRLNLTRQMSNYEAWMSWGSMSAMFSGSTPGRILSMMAKGTASVQ